MNYQTKPKGNNRLVFAYLFSLLSTLCSTAYADGVLENGVALTNLSSSSTDIRFTFDVPEGATNLAINMSGGTGDGDLYVKFGSAPTSSSYDCRPYVGGNGESCPISEVQAGTYHVMISPYSAFTGVSLLASYNEGSGGGGGSGGGAALNENNLSGAAGSNSYFTLDVPAGASNLSFNMSGGSGDAEYGPFAITALGD